MVWYVCYYVFLFAVNNVCYILPILDTLLGSCFFVEIGWGGSREKMATAAGGSATSVTHIRQICSKRQLFLRRILTYPVLSQWWSSWRPNRNLPETGRKGKLSGISSPKLILWRAGNTAKFGLFAGDLPQWWVISRSPAAPSLTDNMVYWSLKLCHWSHLLISIFFDNYCKEMTMYVSSKQTANADKAQRYYK